MKDEVSTLVTVDRVSPKLGDVELLSELGEISLRGKILAIQMTSRPERVQYSYIAALSEAEDSNKYASNWLRSHHEVTQVCEGPA